MDDSLTKNFLRGLAFILLTLVVPFLLTRLLNNNNQIGKEIPPLDDIRIQASTISNATIDFDTYVTGVILASIPYGYEYETIKAQAVIARTYALKNISICNQYSSKNTYTASELGLPYIDSSSFLMNTKGQDSKSFLANVKKAVSDTKNQVITYKNNLITPLYFRTSAGCTRDCTDLFSTSIPYLKSVDSSQDVESPDYIKISLFTIDSVIEALQKAFSNHLLDASDYDYQVYETLPLTTSNFFDSIEITKRDHAGYVLSISLGGILVSGDSFAEALCLTSSCFYIENYDKNVRLISNGFGHGIGFSQYGANYLTQKKQYNYIDLLKYYFSGIKVQEF